MRRGSSDGCGLSIGLVVLCIAIIAGYANSPWGKDTSRRIDRNDCEDTLIRLVNQKKKVVTAFKLKKGDPFPDEALDLPKCPSGGTYHLNPVGQYPTCDFVDDKYPHKLPY